MTLTVATRRYVILTFLRWFATGLALPVLVLLARERGLGLATIGVLMTIYSVTTLVLELPTGGVADVVGRRPVLMCASAAAAISYGVVAFAQSSGAWVAGVIAMGLARALDSGPLQAWFVDASHAVDPTANVRKGISMAATASAAGIGGGALASGALVTFSPLPHRDATLIALSTPMIAAALIAVVTVALVAWWVSEATGDFSSGPRAIIGDVPSTLRRGAVLATSVPELRRILLVTASLGIALASIELLAPGHFGVLLGGSSDAAGPYAAIVTAGFAGSAVGSSLAPLATRLLRRPTIVIAFASLGAGVALPLVGAASVAVACVAFVTFYLLISVGGPLLDEITHDAVNSSERATVLSMRSMALQGAAAVASISMGALSTATSIAVSLGAAGSVLALGALALRRFPARDQAPACTSSGTKSTPVSLRCSAVTGAGAPVRGSKPPPDLGNAITSRIES